MLHFQMTWRVKHQRRKVDQAWPVDCDGLFADPRSTFYRRKYGPGVRDEATPITDSLAVR